MSKIIYAATPFRLSFLTKQICNFIESKAYFPVHPLLALPYDRYNYGRHDKELIYKVCFGLVDISDELWIFGVGTGAFKEYLYAQDKGKPVKSFAKAFDENYEEVAGKEKYQTKYKKVLEEVLQTSALPEDICVPDFTDRRIT